LAWSPPICIITLDLKKKERNPYRRNLGWIRAELRVGGPARLSHRTFTFHIEGESPGSGACPTFIPWVEGPARLSPPGGRGREENKVVLRPPPGNNVRVIIKEVLI
jgi:hypothetical protein